MLGFVFGNVERHVVHHRNAHCAAGFIIQEFARVRWFLSTDRHCLPPCRLAQKAAYRSIVVDGEEIEFSDGFTDLHTRSYEEILKGNGFSIEDVRPSTEAVCHIRTAHIEPSKGERHPYLEGQPKVQYSDVLID
jgi:UDP-N-acetyl-2-amino-2-deoxyglucuronate dehydrogenase